jgi:two-component system nitrogen regulation response regulator NtrX
MIKILVIDDSAVIRDLLREYLTDLGCAVDLAKDGQEGIRKALAGDYRVAFCDIHMPKKNGYQVFREVSAKKPELIFVMTDSLPGPLTEMAQKEGAHRCLTKPFDLEQVKEALQAVLSPTSMT